MKRIAIILSLAAACAGVGWAAYRGTAGPAPESLSKFVPAGPLLYLEAKDFSALLHDWNSSAEKRAWIQSDNYEVFSRSRLLLRLKGAGEQFAAAAGLPPDMDFLSQVAGERSVLALYDIGKLQFLYITYLPSARSSETRLWQTRAKFEPRNAGGVDFYFRRDPESQREVAFAVSGDYLLLSTREDLMAGALQLMAGKQDRTVESESWWTEATAASGKTGDLRMVLDLKTLVLNGYFRTYWVQQNITDLSQYSAAVCDLFRSPKQYREERVLIRKKDLENAASDDALTAVADVSRLIPDNAGSYIAKASPTPEAVASVLETKLLMPHSGPVPISQFAPQVALTSGEQGSSADLETRIDQAPASASESESASVLKELLGKNLPLASLQVQTTDRDGAGVFVRMHSAIAVASSSDWDEATVESALSEAIRPGLTASRLGVGWIQRSGYRQLDGLLPLCAAVRGKYLLVGDDSGLMESMLAKFSRKPTRAPLELFAGFRHDREGGNFERFVRLIDRPAGASSENGMREPQFFSGNMKSLSTTLSAVAAERIEIRSDGEKVRQSVSYEWSQ